MNFSNGEWIAIVSVVVALVIGIIQILKKNNAKSGSVNVNQSSGSFSKSDQKVSIKFKQNDND